ncbi:MAG: DUF1289 domain-containing protein [Pseudomonadota bacterium]
MTGDSGDNAPLSGPQKVWQRSEPDSPCTAVCLIDPASRLCLGCKRTAEEISRWSRMSHEERAEIRAALPARSAGKSRRSGGRAARIKREM